MTSDYLDNLDYSGLITSQTPYVKLHSHWNIEFGSKHGNHHSHSIDTCEVFDYEERENHLTEVTTDTSDYYNFKIFYDINNPLSPNYQGSFVYTFYSLPVYWEEKRHHNSLFHDAIEGEYCTLTLL